MEEKKRPRLRSSYRCFSSPMEMPAWTETEGDACLVLDGQFGAEMCASLWDTLRAKRVGFESLLGSPSPILELCVVGKVRWEPQKTLFAGGKLQMANVCKAHVQWRFLAS